MLVGITGDVGSGKDTVGDVLVKEFGFTHVSFAAPLKQWVLDLVEPLGVERRHIFGGSPETKQAGQAEPLTMLPPRHYEQGGAVAVYWTGRSLLEYLGTNVGRAIHPDVWVSRLLADYYYEESAGAGARWVVTDLRFPNEFDAIREADGQIWRTRLDVVHTPYRASREWPHLDVVCPAATNWRNACGCGSIRSTGHASDEEWRHLPYDIRLSAPKPGVEILQSAARHAITALLQQEYTR